MLGKINNTGGHSYSNQQIGGHAHVHLGDSHQHLTLNIGMVLIKTKAIRATNLKLGSQSRNPPAPIWMVTRKANTLFTGRDEILDDLESLIRESVKKDSEREPCHIVISGIGGQGKSEICIQVTHRLHKL